MSDAIRRIYSWTFDPTTERATRNYMLSNSLTVTPTLFGDSLDVPFDTDAMIVCVNEGRGLRPIELLLTHQLYTSEIGRILSHHPDTKQITLIPANSDSYMDILDSVGWPSKVPPPRPETAPGTAHPDQATEDPETHKTIMERLKISEHMLKLTMANGKRTTFRDVADAVFHHEPKPMALEYAARFLSKWDRGQGFAALRPRHLVSLGLYFNCRIDELIDLSE